MKHKIIFGVLLAMLAVAFSSCKNEGTLNYPILYVVNSTDYTAKVYCDNRLVTTVGARNNSGKVTLSNTSVNLPVYVEAVFYNSSGSKVHSYNWPNYYFQFNKSYKMTLTTSSSTSKITVL